MRYIQGMSHPASAPSQAPRDACSEPLEPATEYGREVLRTLDGADERTRALLDELEELDDAHGETPTPGT